MVLRVALPRDADRPLDGLEQTFIVASTYVRVNALGIAKLRGRLDPEHLRAGLDAVQRRHPMTRVHVEGPLAAPRWVTAGTPPIPLRVVERPDGHAWERAVDEEMATPFDFARGPLLRVVHVRGDEASEVLCTFHHSIGDGLSVLNLLREAFTVAAAASYGKAAPLDPLPAHPPMRDLNPVKPGDPATQARVRREVRKLLWQVFVRRPARLRADRVVPISARRTALVLAMLTREETDALRRRAKQEGTTVTGALVAAMLLAGAEDTGKRALTLGCACPVDLRRHLPAEPPELRAHAFGYLSWGVSVFQRIAAGQRFWDLARHSHAELEGLLLDQAAETSLALAEQRAPKVAAIGGRRLAEALDKHYLTSVAISNMGVLEAPASFGDFAWEEVRFGMTADAGGANLGASVCTFRGRLTLNFVHAKDLFTPERAQRIVDRTVGLLREAAAGDPSFEPGRR